MKRLIYCLLIIFLLSCSNDKPEVVSKQYLYEKVFEDNYPVDFEIYLETIENSKKISRLIERLIYQNNNLDDYVLHIEDRFVKDAENTNVPFVLNNDGIEYYYKSYLYEDYYITYFDNSYVIFCFDTYYYYSGTAHGNFWTDFYFIDIAEERLLEIDELIMPIPDNILRGIINNEYDTDGYSFLRENLWQPDAVNITDTGVELIWNIYSILPYFFGTIWIEVPEEISGQYLTPKGREIFSRIKESVP